MKKQFIASLASFILVVLWQSGVLAGEKTCGGKDAVCREFAALASAGRQEKIVEKVNPKQTYSEPARDIIGQACLALAGKEDAAPERKERLYRKAIEFGAASAYMGLYSLHSKTDPVKAYDLLRRYVDLKPQDAAPYVLLGEADLKKGDYQSAKEYLIEARKVSAEKSGSLDWLLFKASFLAGDYRTASTMLDSSFSNGKTVGDLKALVASDRRFAEMGRLNEFRKFYTILNGREAVKLSSRS